jgi:tetratricopeptide (TPR) repeat protein
VTCYSVCAALAPELPWPYFNRGLAHLRQRDYAQARADFDRVLRLKADLSEAHVNRALALQGLNRPKEAVDDLTEALKLGNPATRVYFMRARAHEQAGDKEAARLDRAEGMRRRPTDALSWIARGMARLADDAPGALADFEEALALNPRSRSALQNKAHVLAERLQRTEEAVRVLDRVLELYPEYVPARSGRGVLHARQGRRDAALADAREALARDGRPQTRYQAACIYAMTSRQHPADRGKALQLLAEALRQGYGAGLLARDTDLDPLRRLPEFQRLVTANASFQAVASGKPPP